MGLWNGFYFYLAVETNLGTHFFWNCEFTFSCFYFLAGSSGVATSWNNLRLVAYRRHGFNQQHLHNFGIRSVWSRCACCSHCRPSIRRKKSFFVRWTRNGNCSDKSYNCWSLSFAIFFQTQVENALYRPNVYLYNELGCLAHV